jgi:hypothetical protein
MLMLFVILVSYRPEMTHPAQASPEKSEYQNPKQTRWTAEQNLDVQIPREHGTKPTTAQALVLPF